MTKRGAGGFIVSKIDTIVYPYLVWSIIQGSVEVALSRYTTNGIAIADVATLLWNPRMQYWFLYALFLVFLLCTLIYTVLPKRWHVPLIVVFALANIFRQDVMADRIPTFLLNFTVFFVAGIHFNGIRAKLFAWHRFSTPLLGILFVVSQYVFHEVLGLQYDSAGFALLLAATIAILFVISLSMTLAESKSWLTRVMLAIGSYSMTIFVMHTLACSGIRIVLSKLFGIESAEVHLFSGVTLGIVVPLAAQALIDRYRLHFLLVRPKLRFPNDMKMVSGREADQH